MAILLHSCKCVIIDGQRDHWLLSVLVLKHVLVVEHLLDGVQSGQVLHLLLLLGYLLVLEFVLPSLVLRQLGVKDPGPIVPDVAMVGDA